MATMHPLDTAYLESKGHRNVPKFTKPQEDEGKG
jgi:hypothetical protein